MEQELRKQVELLEKEVSVLKEIIEVDRLINEDQRKLIEIQRIKIELLTKNASKPKQDWSWLMYPIVVLIGISAMIFIATLKN